MKPFNLERALAGDPVCTRDRRKVLQLFYADKAMDHSQVLAVLDSKIVNCYFKNGSYYENGEECANDLFMAEKPKKKLWIAVETEKVNFHFYSTSYAYESYESLEEAVNKNFKYQVIEIEIDTE